MVHTKVAMCVADVERAWRSRERGVPYDTYVHISTIVLPYNQSLSFCNKRCRRSWKRYHACDAACRVGEFRVFTFQYQWGILHENHGPMYIERANIMGLWVAYMATPVLQRTTLTPLIGVQYYHVRQITKYDIGFCQKWLPKLCFAAWIIACAHVALKGHRPLVLKCEWGTWLLSHVIPWPVVVVSCRHIMTPCCSCAPYTWFHENHIMCPIS